MRAPAFLFGFAALACVTERAVPPAERAPTSVPPPTVPLVAVVTACRARPSTVYGAEPVTFTIDGTGGSTAAFELVGDRGESVARGSIDVPGMWQAGELASGDYALKVGSAPISCPVTVNRELSRQPAAAPK